MVFESANEYQGARIRHIFLCADGNTRPSIDDIQQLIAIVKMMSLRLQILGIARIDDTMLHCVSLSKVTVTVNAVSFSAR